MVRDNNTQSVSSSTDICEIDYKLSVNILLDSHTHVLSDLVFSNMTFE